ncbi:chemotaxis protein CheX [Spongiibacter sp.]|uniref:chemotaxis protein CheX n=1 Tax=Spongiibacter sp. TaxID=2024860 RepID=UPI003568EE99
MTEDKLQIFIDGVSRYFEHTEGNDLRVGTPYLAANSEPVSMDYTGIIGVSGSSKGCVYFTAPKAMLKHMILSLGEPDTSEANMVDLVGEVANTISGNARRELGKEFMISVPVVVSGTPSRVHLPADLRSYVVPATWRSYHAAVVICLQR